MKRTGIAAAIAAIMMCISLTSCGGKSSSESSSSETTTAAGETAASEENETVSETSTAAEETTAEQTTAAAAEEKTSETTAEKTTEPAAEKKDEGGYTDVTALAQTFYNAYLGHDPEAVYALFDTEEIDGYSKLIKDELEGKDPAVVFSKKAVVSAIDQSMTSISEIMDAYSDSGQDEWTVEVTADDLEDVEEAQLDDFNGDLSTSYAAAKIINYVFYRDKSNDQSFTGNSSAFLNKNGKWYLSYSSLMQSELINYIDL